MNYSIENYNLKDVICDDTGKCNNYAKKDIRLTITSTKNYTGTIQLDFDFKQAHSITYKNLTGNYLKTILDNDSVSINLQHDSPKFVLVNSSKNINYSYSNNILTLNNVTCDLEIEGIVGIYKYAYTGNYQTFTAPKDGLYKIELWGAQGGTDASAGAYTSGNINLTAGKKNIFMLEKNHQEQNAGYNGGGQGFKDNYSGGAGATYIRLVSGVWNNFDSLKSRIMVAELAVEIRMVVLKGMEEH